MKLRGWWLGLVLASPLGAAGADTIPGFPCYRTVEATLARGAELAANYPTLATWIDIGDSWERTRSPAAGYDLRVLRVTGNGPGPKPVLFVSGGIHPREYASPELAVRFAEKLLASYGQDPAVTAWLDEIEVHVFFQANPDGRKWAETGLSWRKNTNNFYCPDSTDRGADLNRNFSFQWSCCEGGSDDPCSPIFRGATAASEPEITAFEAYLRQILPDRRPNDLETPAPDDTRGLVIDLHSPGELVLAPWGFTATPPPNGPALLAIARRLALPGNYFPRLGSLGPVDGASKDFAYGDLGVPAYTLELGVRFFEPCPFFDLHLAPKALDALVGALPLARRPYQEIFGPVASNVAASPPRPLIAGTTVTVTALLDDTRFATGNGVEPSQPLAEAEVCLGAPPPGAGATCFPLAAADGAFDETAEAVIGTLATTTLGPGRHAVYVRGRDADENWGPPTATAVTVLDETAGKLVLRLLDGDTRAPLVGTVTAAGFSVTSGEDGTARLDVPAGSYALTVTAPDHAPATLTVSLEPTGDVEREVLLSPFAVTFADDAEGTVAWTASPPWARTTETAAGGTTSWADSPGGPYTPGVDTALTSPVFDLRLARSVELEFQHRFDLVQSFDLAQVETSIDGGATWEPVAIFTGLDQTTWRPNQLSLPGLAGAPTAQIRFRLTSRALTPRDGWHLDDIVLKSAQLPAFLFADGFESGDVSRWSGGLLGRPEGPPLPWKTGRFLR